MRDLTGIEKVVVYTEKGMATLYTDPRVTIATLHENMDDNGANDALVDISFAVTGRTFSEERYGAHLRLEERE